MSPAGRPRYLVAAACASIATIAGFTLSSRPSGTAAAGAATPAPAPEIIPVAARRPAPQLTAAPLTGPAEIRLARGQVYVLAFWSSWCTPCRSELRQLQTAWRSRPSATELIGIDVDDSPGPARAAMRAAGANFPDVSDPRSALATDYRIAGTPTLVVIDRSGREAARALGPTPAATILSLIRRVGGAGASHV